MIKAVLLDLDNTLILNPDASFAHSFLEILTDYFRSTPEQDIVPAFVQALRRLGVNRDIRSNNAQALIHAISEQTGWQPGEVSAAIYQFYQERFNAFESLIQPVRGAAALIESLVQRKVAVVITTNPLYPLEAVEQRLRWGGLPSDGYALITHSGNMHFAKPDPAYYAEIAARIGVEPDEALMIGDSYTNDIQPAQTVGMQVIAVEPKADDPLYEVRRCLDEPGWFELSVPPHLKPEMIEPEMRGNLGALYGILEGVKPHFWLQHSIPNEWSLIQIVCHLLASEHEVQFPRLLRIRDEDNPFLQNAPTPPDPEHFKPCDEDGWNVVAQFVEARQRTLQWLGQLKSDEWSRRARHSTFGLTTLLEMAHFTAQHDRLHINQICQTLGRCE